MSEEVLTISLREYVRLRMAEIELDHLSENGVDNWEGYGEDSKGLEKKQLNALKKILGRNPTEEDLEFYDIFLCEIDPEEVNE